MGTHHDNFFLWNSKIHSWNAVQMGPKKDVRRALAEGRQGERPSVSVFPSISRPATLGFRSATARTQTGPMEGVPYDGNDPKYQDLYHPKLRGRGHRLADQESRVAQEDGMPRSRNWSTIITPTFSTRTADFPSATWAAHMVAHFYNSNEANRRQADRRL